MARSRVSAWSPPLAGGDAVGRAVFGKCLDGVVDLVAVLADDDGAATGGHDVSGGLASHPTAPADDHQFCPAKRGMAVGRSVSSSWLCMPSSQFVLVEVALIEWSSLMGS